MTAIDEGRLRFSFPDAWVIARYDRWTFFHRFKSSCGGNKGVDVLALDGTERLWLIEVKDYRQQRRTREDPLWEEVAIKVRDTLAGLVAASLNASDDAERRVAKECLAARHLSVVLHLERAEHRSKLFANFPDSADLVQKLKQLLKPIDPHPRVLDLTGRSPWRVESI